MNSLPLHPLPPNSEWMTFETNRNADCEDCFNRILSKGQAQMKASQNDCCCQAGQLCFPLSPEADLNACVCFVFLFCFFFQEHYRLAVFMLGILRCLYFSLPKANRAKSLRCLVRDTLCTFLSVIFSLL